MLTKFRPLFRHEGVYAGLNRLGGRRVQYKYHPHFRDNRAAMCTTTIFQIENFLTPADLKDYGIAPMPKYDEARKLLHAHPGPFQHYVGSSTVPEEDLPMMGAVMADFGNELGTSTTPITIPHSYKYLQNQESVIMLDLVYRRSRWRQHSSTPQNTPCSEKCAALFRLAKIQWPRLIRLSRRYGKPAPKSLTRGSPISTIDTPIHKTAEMYCPGRQAEVLPPGDAFYSDLQIASSKKSSGG